MTGYGTLVGLRLTVRGKAVCNLPAGDLEYINLELTEIDYNQSVETLRTAMG